MGISLRHLAREQRAHNFLPSMLKGENILGILLIKIKFKINFEQSDKQIEIRPLMIETTDENTLGHAKESAECR